jgi:hypothetical protein
LEGRRTFFTEENVKLFYFNVKKFKEGKRWAILVGCAGLAAVATPLYPAAKGVIKDA